jgi:hypothetical protein
MKISSDWDSRKSLVFEIAFYVDSGPRSRYAHVGGVVRPISEGGWLLPRILFSFSSMWKMFCVALMAPIYPCNQSQILTLLPRLNRDEHE